MLRLLRFFNSDYKKTQFYIIGEVEKIPFSNGKTFLLDDKLLEFVKDNKHVELKVMSLIFDGNHYEFPFFSRFKCELSDRGVVFYEKHIKGRRLQYILEIKINSIREAVLFKFQFHNVFDSE